jgi:ribosome recycling factor
MRSSDFIANHVIHADMSAGTLGNAIAELSKNVIINLRMSAKQHNVSLVESYFVTAFNSLISDVHNFNERKVVLLIDEYDAHVIDAITSNMEKSNLGLLAARRDAMQDFCSVIKLNDKIVKLAFITGIIKFSRMR